VKQTERSLVGDFELPFVDLLSVDQQRNSVASQCDSREIPLVRLERQCSRATAVARFVEYVFGSDARALVVAVGHPVNPDTVGVVRVDQAPGAPESDRRDRKTRIRSNRLRASDGDSSADFLHLHWLTREGNSRQVHGVRRRCQSVTIDCRDLQRSFRNTKSIRSDLCFLKGRSPAE
jgi:hypothetical protein